MYRPTCTLKQLLMQMPRSIFVIGPFSVALFRIITFFIINLLHITQTSSFYSVPDIVAAKEPFSVTQVLGDIVI